MPTKKIVLAASAILACMPLAAQQTPESHVVANCVKVTRGKTAEFAAFARATMMKMAQQRANAGEIASWSLLRTVYPAGEESRCDFTITTTYNGKPGAPRGSEDTAKALMAAGVVMSADEFYTKREALSRLVATEVWRTQLRTGKIEKGNYVALNMMKVRNMPAYAEFEAKVWLPMAEQWINDGVQTSWAFATRVYPAGSEREHNAYTVDVYPNWEAAFGGRAIRPMFEKVHAGKDIQKTLEPMSKVRDLARRDLLYVMERVTK